MSNHIRYGSWQTVLANIECDTLICDPPYGKRTHKGQSALRDPLGYEHWTPEHVHEFVESWSPRTYSWMVCFTSHDLIPHWEAAYAKVGRYHFAPVIVLQPVPRLTGDGPSNWARYVMAARSKTREAARWRALPGAYRAPCERGAPIRGAKPVSLMRELVRDYSAKDDLICDPCSGWGSTRIAALTLGRRFIGAERVRSLRDAALSRPIPLIED